MRRFYQATVGDDFHSELKKYNIGVELDYFCQSENLAGERLDESMKKIRQMIAEGLCHNQNMIIHGPFNEVHPAAIDSEALALAERRINQALDICYELDVRKMVVHSGYIPFVYFKSWHRDRSIDFWQELMDKRTGEFTLCIENVLEDEPYMMGELMEALISVGGGSDIGICLDIGHANCMSNIPVTEWIKTLAPYIRHFHLHNNDGKNDCHMSFNQGILNMDEIMKTALALCREDTTFTVESINCSDSLQWLRERGYIDER